MVDAIIIGAGLTGSACALALAQAGMRVVVLERGQLGEHAASSAAAGMLGAQLERHPAEAMQQLCLLSRARYPEWLDQLGDQVARRCEFRVTGALHVAMSRERVAPLQTEVLAQQQLGLRAEWLEPKALRARVPPLTEAVCGAAWYPDDGLLDPPVLLQQVSQAASRHGVELREGCAVAELLLEPGEPRRVTGVKLRDGSQLLAPWVVLAAGSWTSLLGGLLPLGVARDAVVPVRGQMIQLQLPEPLFDGAIEGPGAYLSPRRDGRVLVGATVEQVGFERALVPAAIDAMQAAATRMLPALRAAHREIGWCGFRAATADRLPLFDDSLAQGLVLCSGHFRNGVLLAPISAAIVAAMLLGTDPPLEVAPFRLQRLLASG